MDAILNCTISYLEHWKNNVDHQLIPIKKIDYRIEEEKKHEHKIDTHPLYDL